MLIYQKPELCAVCSSRLETHLTKVRDRIYGVAGTWNLDRCSNRECGVIYLAHSLTTEQLASFYASYSTHSVPVVMATGLKKLYRESLQQVRHRRLGYPAARNVIVRGVGWLLDHINYFRENALGRVFWLPERVGGEVIEVGFGNSQTMCQLREAGWSVRGSEFDDVCIAQARSLGFDAVKGNFADGLFDAQSADAVVASHTIEHLPDPRAFMLEAFRVLRSGGMLVLSTPNARSLGADRMGQHWRGLEVPRHLSIHSPGSLLRLAADAGFVDAEVVGTPLNGFGLQQNAELRSGRSLSPAQNRKTWIYNVIASIIAGWNDQVSEEIVLRCTKP